MNAAPTVVCEGRASSTPGRVSAWISNVTRYTQHAIATRLECEHPHGQVAWQWFCPMASSPSCRWMAQRVGRWPWSGR